MFAARVDIINHTTDTVDVQVNVFPTSTTDPQIGSFDVLDNSSPPITLLAAVQTIPDCAPSVVNFVVRDIPITRLPITVKVTSCGSVESVSLGPFLQSMSPQGEVPCSSGLDLPASQDCLMAQEAVRSARNSYLAQCGAISAAKGRRDAALMLLVGLLGGAIATAGLAVAVTVATLSAAATVAAANIAAVAAGAAASASSFPIIGWVIAAVLLAAALVLVALIFVWLSEFNSAQSAIDAARAAQNMALQAFNEAVRSVAVKCCPQQISSTVNLETPTCPSS